MVPPPVLRWETRRPLLYRNVYARVATPGFWFHPARTANDTFDVGRDSYSPVSEAYFDRKPFAFNGNINKLHVAYK